MSRVFVLMKHPQHPFSGRYGSSKEYLRAGEIQGIYTERSEPDRIAAQKNARHPIYLWVVHAKQVKTTDSK